MVPLVLFGGHLQAVGEAEKPTLFIGGFRGVEWGDLKVNQFGSRPGGSSREPSRWVQSVDVGVE